MRPLKAFSLNVPAVSTCTGFFEYLSRLLAFRWMCDRSENLNLERAGRSLLARSSGIPSRPAFSSWLTRGSR
jgi:hypothetical protein